jgi:hypothetical protein
VVGEGVGDAVSDGDGEAVWDAGGVVRGGVVRGGTGADTRVVGAGVVGPPESVAVGDGGRYPVRSGATVGRPGSADGVDELAGAVDPAAELTTSVGAGSPGPSGCGEDEEVGRSATVAPTKAATTTTIPATAPISASRRRRPASAGSSTYRSREPDESGPRSAVTRSRTRARPSLIRSPTPGTAAGARVPDPDGPGRPVRGSHALPTYR